MSHTRLLKCFALQHSMIKTKYLRSRIRHLVQGFERVEILEIEVGIGIIHQFLPLVETLLIMINNKFWV